jgi:ADP-ribosylglycohydrolase
MNHITTGLLGLSVADAIGVPVEFRSREELDRDPVTDVRGYGTYNQPPGYFSDDSSLAFGLAESLATGEFDLLDQAHRLVRYKQEGYWTPAGELFDIGITTSRAIDQLIPLVTAGRSEELQHLRAAATEFDNGNGALMRIFPLYAFLRSRPKAGMAGLYLGACCPDPRSHSFGLMLLLIPEAMSLSGTENGPKPCVEFCTKGSASALFPNGHIRDGA